MCRAPAIKFACYKLNLLLLLRGALRKIFVEKVTQLKNADHPDPSHEKDDDRLMHRELQDAAQAGYGQCGKTYKNQAKQLFGDDNHRGY